MDKDIRFSSLNVEEQECIHFRIKLVANQIKRGNRIHSPLTRLNQITHCKTPEHAKHLLQLRQNYKNYLKHNQNLLDMNQKSCSIESETDKVTRWETPTITNTMILKVQPYTIFQEGFVNDSVVSNANLDSKAISRKRRKTLKMKRIESSLFQFALKEDYKLHPTFPTSGFLKLKDQIFVVDESIGESKNRCFIHDSENLNECDEIQFQNTAILTTCQKSNDSKYPTESSNSSFNIGQVSDLPTTEQVNECLTTRVIDSSISNEYLSAKQVSECLMTRVIDSTISNECLSAEQVNECSTWSIDPTSFFGGKNFIIGPITSEKMRIDSNVSQNETESSGLVNLAHFLMTHFITIRSSRLLH